MSRYTEASCKKCRKLDCKLFLKGTKCYTNCVVDKLAATVKRGGKVRRAKLNYLKKLSGKAARLQELKKPTATAEAAQQEPAAAAATEEAK